MSTNPYETPQQVGSSQVSPPAGWGGTFAKVFAVLLTGAVLIALLLPTCRFPREAARRSSCNNNLRQIALALQYYYDEYGGYPPAYTVDATDKPLHSWRTLILPYLEQKALYDTIDLSKPWDDPANAKACATEVPTYQCPSAFRKQQEGNLTTYLASVGPNAAIHPTRLRKPLEIIDGISKTLMVLEVPTDKAVPWMSPQDANEGLFLSIRKDAKLAHGHGFNTVFADGHVQFLPADTPQGKRKAIVSIAGGE